MTVPLHHEAPADPVLMEWIKEKIDQLISQDPGVLVAIFGTVLVSIPIVILLVYLLQRKKG